MMRSLAVHLFPRGVAFRLWLRCSLLLWGTRLALAWAASRPLAVVVGAGDYEDRLLFEPGALILLEVLRLRADLILDALGSTALLLLGSWGVLLVVTTAVLAQLSRAGASIAPTLPSGRGSVGANLWASLPRVGVVTLLAGAAGVLVVLITALVAGAVHGGLRGASAPAREIAMAGVLLTSLLPLGVIGALLDLARIFVVAEDQGVTRAVRLAWASFAEHLGRLVAVRLGVALASLAVVAGVATLVATQPLGAPEGGPVTIVVLLHRAAGLLLAGLQVTWFAVLVQSALPGAGQPRGLAEGQSQAG